jgi:uncharacterized repeat protein (TIGR03803 family)
MPSSKISRYRLALRSAALFLVITITGSAANAQTFTTLYSFTGSPDGSGPGQENLLNVNGTLYGTTDNGGAYGYGAIFRLNSSGKDTVLYSFTGGTDGEYPNSGLVLDSKGNFYGTTQNGGDLSCNIISGFTGCGVVYKLDSAGHFSVLYNFTGSTDGAWPQGVILDSTGNLYGPSFFGGDLDCPPLPGIGCGVVFKVAPQGSGWTETTLYTFLGSTDGATPNGFLTRDKAGNLYGVTFSGGNMADCSGAGCGVVFKVTASGKESVLYAFTGGTDGANANGNLLIDGKGNVYGTTYAGGDLSCSNNSSVGCGVVFKITPAHHEVVIHTFKGPDGAGPSYGLVADVKGDGYSTTIYGGTSNLGTVFEVTSAGVEKVLHSFTGGADGGLPESGLIIDKQGTLYSNTFEGGNLSCNPPNGCGTVFKIVF